MDSIIKKQKLLKELFEQKEDKEKNLNSLNEEQKALKIKYDNMESLIKISKEFRTCINASKKYKITKKEKILMLFNVIIISTIIILINFLTKNFFDIINFPINTNFIILSTFVEVFGTIDILILKPYFEHKIEVHANNEMKKYILTEEKELSLQKEKELILQNKKLVNDKINVISDDIKLLNERIINILFELFKEPKIKDLLVENIINKNENFDDEINLIIEDYDNKISRVRSI